MSFDVASFYCFSIILCKTWPNIYHPSSDFLLAQLYYVLQYFELQKNLLTCYFKDPIWLVSILKLIHLESLETLCVCLFI